MGRRVTTVMLLLLGVAFLAGCSGSVYVHDPTVDAAKMQDDIAKQLQADNPDLRGVGVTCPEGVEHADGACFQCTAELEGVKAQFTVTMRLKDPSTGEFDCSWKPAKPIIDVDKIVQEVEQQYTQSPNAKVDCGTAPVRVVDAGDTIDCTISEGRERTVVHAVVEDAEGTIRFEQPG